MKNKIKKVIDFISVIIIVVALFVIVDVVLLHPGEPPTFLGYSVFRVLTGSMEPTIPTNSIVIVKHVSYEDVNEGDVISFYSRDPALSGSINTHRVIRIEGSGEDSIFHTQGDANTLEDYYLVYPEDIVGKVVKVSKFFGLLVRLFSNPLIFGPFIALPLIVIAIVNIVRTVKTSKDIAEKEDEEFRLKKEEELTHIEELNKKAKELEDKLKEVDRN